MSEKLSEWVLNAPRLTSREEIAERVGQLEASLEQMRAVVDEYRSRGYHSPMERCPHGISHWIGDHCAFDSRALATLEE